MSSTSQSHDQPRDEQPLHTTLPAATGIQPYVTPALLNSLEWRSIGPFRGGRVVAVAADMSRSHVFYFGSTGGGIWKTTDGGVYWENISDGFFKRASVGALAVAPSDPNVLYVGMGETTIRGNVSHGDGVYKSTDGGKTWMHMGLEDTRHIGKVRIHPQNPDLVYVAALGHAHGPNNERGIFRSRDGGKHWEHILFRGEDIGSHDLALDPHNPRILYAALWRARRMPHTLQSGGEGCGIFKSTDGGDTWTELTRNPGLPTGTVGKIGIAVSGARADRVWAIVEAEDGAVFRSDDGGETWERLNEERDLWKRPWYYQHIFADPQDPETIWVLNEDCFKSHDGGRTFVKIATPHGDHHDLWIDPHNPQRIIMGHDGGACVSFNGADTWSSIYNQPTAEFYHVTTDNQVPYRLYGGQQDNSTITVPARSRLSAITQAEYYEIGGGESGYIAVRPDDPNIVYAGSYLGYLTRYDHRSGHLRDITVWPESFLGAPASDAKYRFQWTFPILLSPHDPDVLYVTGNHVFRSTDEGSSWEVISPDLTRNDQSKMGPSGGPITQDNVGTEYYGTIFAFSESPLQRGLFWAGSDDGLVHISQDGGKTWDDVTPSDVPKWALISIIEPSPLDAATAYLAATCYKSDDFQPYLFKTYDYGKTWTKITTGIQANDFTRVIRADTERRGLLFAGTETGVHVSFDDGEHWQSLQQNLPVVPIHDLAIKDSDLLAATHGRSFWILDDISPLRQLNIRTRDAQAGDAGDNEDSSASLPPAHLFTPRPTTRFVSSSGYGRPVVPGTNYRHTGAFVVAYRRQERPGGVKVDKYLDSGQNPPNGVIVHYSLEEKPAGEVTLTFLDAAGTVIRTFSSEEKPAEQSSVEATNPTNLANPAGGNEKKDEKKEPRVPKEIGANRFVWNMRYPDPIKIEGYDDPAYGLEGPLAPPGTYHVQLKVGNQDPIDTKPFHIQKDPRVTVTQEDLQTQFALLLAIRDKVSATHDTINTIRAIRRQVDEWERRARSNALHETSKTNEAVITSGEQIKKSLAAIEAELLQIKAKKQLDTLDFPVKLSGKLAELSGVVASADAAPTRQAREVFEDLSASLDTQLQRLRQLITIEVAAFNTLIRDSQVPAIMPTAQQTDRAS